MVQQTKGVFDGLNIKPDIQTILESETDGPGHNTGNPKTPVGRYWNKQRSDPMHHNPASDAVKCATALYGFVLWIPSYWKIALFQHMFRRP